MEYQDTNNYDYNYYNKPKTILYISNYIINNTIYIYYIIMFSGLYIGIYLTDADYQQGEYYRIIYIHVTSA